MTYISMRCTFRFDSRWTLQKRGGFEFNDITYVTKDTLCYKGYATRTFRCDVRFDMRLTLQKRRGFEFNDIPLRRERRTLHYKGYPILVSDVRFDILFDMRWTLQKRGGFEFNDVTKNTLHYKGHPTLVDGIHFDTFWYEMNVTKKRRFWNGWHSLASYYWPLIQ
jgi:hypothetical protein